MRTRLNTIEGGVRPFLVAHPENRFVVGQERAARGRSFWVYPDARSFVPDFVAEGKTWHEYVVPDRPVKLYFDLDDKRKREGWSELEMAVSNCVTNALGRSPEMRVWEAHTEEKFSAHFVFPDVWFDCAASLSVFVKTIHAQLDRDDRMDVQVYTESATVFKSMRVPYCASYGKTNTLRPRGGPAEFDESWFLESLITHPHDGVPDEGQLLRFAVPDAVVARDIQEDEDPVRMLALEKIERFIRVWWSLDKIELKQRLDAETGRWVWHVRPGLWCPIKKRRHLNNNTMIWGRMTCDSLVTLETFCLDGDCRHWTENRDFDWSAIAFGP